MALVALTRGMAGTDVGLLIGGFMQRETRRALGWTLFTRGAVSTVPMLLVLLGAP